MAKTRFRRKSHSKKNKTARRQKRQSRRMRGGHDIDHHKILQWARQNPGCSLKVSPGDNVNFTPKEFRGSIIRDTLSTTEMKIKKLKEEMMKLPRNVSESDLVLTSECAITPAYDRT